MPIFLLLFPGHARNTILDEEREFCQETHLLIYTKRQANILKILSGLFSRNFTAACKSSLALPMPPPSPPTPKEKETKALLVCQSSCVWCRMYTEHAHY